MKPRIRKKGKFASGETKFIIEKGKETITLPKAEKLWDLLNSPNINKEKQD